MPLPMFASIHFYFIIFSYNMKFNLLTQIGCVFFINTMYCLMPTRVLKPFHGCIVKYFIFNNIWHLQIFFAMFNSLLNNSDTLHFK